MNPFDLRGPEFLLFYFVFSITVFVALHWARRLAESGDAPKTDLSDPYLIAYLRGGENETMRVAMISLIDRGLLTVNGTTIKLADRALLEQVTQPLDLMLLKKFATGDSADSVYKSPSLKSACQPYADRLKRQGLLPDDETKSRRATRFLIGAVFLLGCGFLKILIALSRGKTNIGILIVMMIVATIIAAVISFPRLTRRGKETVEDIRTLYAGLKTRGNGYTTNPLSSDAIMLAAVFGVGMLAADPTHAYAQTLFPRAMSSNGSSSSGCGSSCGSSCGGGGCGGGGCGGCGG